MKIGIDISQIVYQGTGVASYTSSLVEGFSRVGRENQYYLFGSSLRNRNILKEFAGKLDKKVFKKRLYFFPPKLLELLWNGIHVVPIETLIGSVDVFHSSDWLEPSTRKAKRITTIHDMIVYKYPDSFKARGGHNIVANQKRKLFFTRHYSDMVIAVSETTKQDIMDILKIPDKKIKVIYEAADPLYYSRSKNEIDLVKEKYQIKENYFLCVGTREPRKNIDRLVTAFTQIERDFPDTSLVIAGKYGWGDDSSKLALSQLKGSKLEEKVKILGYVEKEDLARLYSGARAFVYPSLYEGFGLPILEAMACGCPVITSNTGSMKEISGGAAKLCDPESTESIAESMLKIAKEEKSSLRERSLKRAGEFSWDNTALQTLESYRSLLE